MNTSKNTIAKNVKGNKANDLTTISEMTNNFYPNANFRVLESLVLFWTSKVVFWRRRPDFTDVNTCAVYSHWHEWLSVGVRDLKNVGRSHWPSGVFPWECANMVVTSGCFAFRTPLSTRARIGKKFKLSWKLDKFALFTYSFVSWNLENLYKDFFYKTSRLVRISLLISATTRSFAGFFLRGN